MQLNKILPTSDTMTLFIITDIPPAISRWNKKYFEVNEALSYSYSQFMQMWPPISEYAS